MKEDAPVAGSTVPGSEQGGGTVDIVEAKGVALCYIIRAAAIPDRTTFVTPPEFKQQVGFVVYPAGGIIGRHTHRSLQRHIVGTSEVLIVQRGRCLLDVFDDARQLVATRELVTGDVMLMVGGGHGFRILEDTVFLEVKQGPYTGVDEKERF
jgi:quercetin dioxygenase-like cupin family protein